MNRSGGDRHLHFSQRVGPICLLAVVCATAAKAEFQVDAAIPAFTLQAADGKTVELRRTAGRLVLKQAGESVQPAALVLHFFQPDCLQCRAQVLALEPIAKGRIERRVVTLGIAHRGDAKAVAAFGKELGITFPLLVGSDSEIARRFAAGDTLGIVDDKGIIRFAQVGYGAGDEKLWAAALDELLAGKSVTLGGVERERLAVGDRLPVVELPSLQDGKPMTLSSKDGRLVFRDAVGKESRPKAVIGFFSRY